MAEVDAAAEMPKTFKPDQGGVTRCRQASRLTKTCLLYTSDAADE